MEQNKAFLWLIVALIEEVYETDLQKGRKTTKKLIKKFLQDYADVSAKIIVIQKYRPELIQPT